MALERRLPRDKLQPQAKFAGMRHPRPVGEIVLKWIGFRVIRMSCRMLMAGLLVAFLAGCNKSWTWHQKITVSVVTPSHIVAASSVMEASIGEKGGWWAPPEASGATTNLRGEAVVLELSPNRYLFGLLTSMPYAYNVFFPHEPPLEIAKKLENMRASRELPPSQYPQFVTFDDINDPTSVRRVDPANLAAVFGPGYELKSITLSITDEPVTKGRVEKVLSWLEAIQRERANLIGRPKHGTVSDQPDPGLYLIAPTDFSTELHR